MEAQATIFIGEYAFYGIPVSSFRTPSRTYKIIMYQGQMKKCHRESFRQNITIFKRYLQVWFLLPFHQIYNLLSS